MIVDSSFFMRRSNDSRILVRNYVVADSAINNLKVVDKSVYIGSEKGESIMKVKLNVEELWGFTETPKDKYSEQLSVEKLKDRLKNVYDKRRRMQTE